MRSILLVLAATAVLALAPTVSAICAGGVACAFTADSDGDGKDDWAQASVKGNGAGGGTNVTGARAATWGLASESDAVFWHEGTFDEKPGSRAYGSGEWNTAATKGYWVLYEEDNERGDVTDYVYFATAGSHPAGVAVVGFNYRDDKQDGKPGFWHVG